MFEIGGCEEVTSFIFSAQMAQKDWKIWNLAMSLRDGCVLHTAESVPERHLRTRCTVQGHVWRGHQHLYVNVVVPSARPDACQADPQVPQRHHLAV